MQEKLITIVMPVYNGVSFLQESITSVLVQTYQNWELVIIDDGSTDNSVKIIKKFQKKNSRIKLIQNKKNLRLAITRNKGLAEAKGEYVAFLDCDDIALPERLALQYKYLETHPEVGVCGGHAQTFGKVKKILKTPTNQDELKASLLFDTPILNSTAMIRRKYFDKYNLKYNRQYPYFAEDYELWLRCSQYMPMVNLDKVLIKYRVGEKTASRANRERNRLIMQKIYGEYFKSIGLSVNKKEAQLHDLIRFTGAKQIDTDFLIEAEQWLGKLLKFNEQKNIWPDKYLKKYCGFYWFDLCRDIKNWKLYKKSELRKLYQPKLRQLIIFFLRSCQV